MRRLLKLSLSLLKTKYAMTGARPKGSSMIDEQAEGNAWKIPRCADGFPARTGEP
jgi:hypothetical protein